MQNETFLNYVSAGNASESKGDVLISIAELEQRYNRGRWAFDRWQRDEKLGFPRPIILRRRRYYKLREIEAFEASFTNCPCYAPKAEAA